eukprot:6337053-Alexandrium_andersonii.AAC.1
MADCAAHFVRSLVMQLAQPTGRGLIGIASTSACTINCAAIRAMHARRMNYERIVCTNAR